MTPERPASPLDANVVPSRDDLYAGRSLQPVRDLLYLDRQWAYPTKEHQLKPDQNERRFDVDGSLRSRNLRSESVEPATQVLPLWLRGYRYHQFDRHQTFHVPHSYPAPRTARHRSTTLHAMNHRFRGSLGETNDLRYTSLRTRNDHGR